MMLGFDVTFPCNRHGRPKAVCELLEGPSAVATAKGGGMARSYKDDKVRLRFSQEFGDSTLPSHLDPFRTAALFSTSSAK